MSTQNTGNTGGVGSDQIKVDYSQAAARTAALSSRVLTEIERIEGEYTFIFRKLDDRDSATNATLIEVAEQNKLKAIEAAQVISRLATFIAKASQVTEAVENNIASSYRTVNTR